MTNKERLVVFLLIAVVVPLLTYSLLPIALSKIVGTTIRANALLLLACFVYFISWFLPSPLIEGRDTSFTTHFVGGGIFTGLVWLYCVRALGWKPFKRYRHWIEAASLFAAVSTLGALNELFELVLVELNIASISLGDTSWDILANTLGAALFYLCYLGYRLSLTDK